MSATAMLAGTVMSGGAKIYGGIQQNKADQTSAALLTEEAGQSVASGIQGAIQANRKATYVASNARARIAAGGLATTSPSEIAEVGQIRGQGQYNALTALYDAESRAQGLDYQAAGMRSEGSASEASGWMGGISTVLSSPSAQSFFAKYGGTGITGSGSGTSTAADGYTENLPG